MAADHLRYRYMHGDKAFCASCLSQSVQRGMLRWFWAASLLLLFFGWKRSLLLRLIGFWYTTKTPAPATILHRTRFGDFGFVCAVLLFGPSRAGHAP